MDQQPTREQQEEARELDTARNEMAFGMDVQQFMKTDIGRYLRKRANDHMEQAFQDFLHVDPTDHKAVVDVQVRGRTPAALLAWLGDAVSDGEAAELKFSELHAQGGE